MTLNLGMHHRVLEYYKICSIDDPGLTLNYFLTRSNLVPYAFEWEKGKTVDFSETIVVCVIWNWQQMTEVTRSFCWHQNFVPWGLYAPAPGLYTCIKSWKKKCIKSRFLWNLQQMGKVIRPFCWHQNFVPWGLSVPALGLYICIKSWRKLYKIRLQRHFFETYNKWMKWQDVPVDIKISSQRGCQPQPWNLHSVPQTLLKMSEILVHIKYNSLIYIVKQELSTDNPSASKGFQWS